MSYSVMPTFNSRLHFDPTPSILRASSPHNIGIQADFANGVAVRSDCAALLSLVTFRVRVSTPFSAFVISVGVSTKV
jgi:hypothetical protein